MLLPRKNLRWWLTSFKPKQIRAIASSSMTCPHCVSISAWSQWCLQSSLSSQNPKPMVRLSTGSFGTSSGQRSMARSRSLSALSSLGYRMRWTMHATSVTPQHCHSSGLYLTSLMPFIIYPCVTPSEDLRVESSMGDWLSSKYYAWGQIGTQHLGRYAALLGRMLASIFCPDEFRNEIFVDDPLMAAAGTEERRDIIFTIALLFMQATGFPLAWGKGVLGTSVTWIGAQLTSSSDGIEVSIPEDKLESLLTQTKQLNASVVASRRSVRSYCGKLSFIGGMVPYIRPFLSMVWAALSSASSLPPALIHCRQFRVALDWLQALLLGRHGPLVRTFPLAEVWSSEGDYIATDACPWGFAGVLFKNFAPIAWFASPLLEGDLRRFRAKRGDSGHNTTWEALALLVAIRLWLPGTSVLARVRSDALSALRSMVKLSSKSPNLNLVARELALDAVLGLYTIGMAVHIPGVSNKLPDDLSRMWALEPHACPLELVDIPEHSLPLRDGSFWRTTTPTHRRGLAWATRSKLS